MSPVGTDKVSGLHSTIRRPCLWGEGGVSNSGPGSKLMLKCGHFYVREVARRVVGRSLERSSQERRKG